MSKALLRKRLISFAGWLIVLASFAYLVVIARRHLDEIPTVAWTLQSGAVAVLAVAIHASTFAIWGVAWKALVKSLDFRFSTGAAFVVIGLTQVGRYVPGKVAFHVARIALAGEYGVQSGAVLATLFLEISLALVAAGACAVIALGVTPEPPFGLQVPLPLLVALLVVALAVPLALPTMLRRWNAGRFLVTGSEPAMSGAVAAGLRLACGGLHLVNLMLQGVVLVLLGRAVLGLPVSYSLACAAAALAWIGAVIVPVPAGVGVREAAVIAVFTPALGGGGAVALAAGVRMVMIIGDVVVFAMASLLRPSYRPRSSGAA